MTRYNRRASDNVRVIGLGKHKYNGGVVSITERHSFGVVVIAAITRYGKSILVRNWYVAVGQTRSVIILDYLGEHSQSAFPNFLSQDNNVQCLPDMVEIKDFHFKISQFDKMGDWISLTFTDRGARLMTQLANKVEAHRDDPQRFYEMLEDVPGQGDYGGVAAFEKKWGFHLPITNTATLDACKSLYASLLQTGFFGQPDDPIYDFGDIRKKHRHININFNLGRTEVGKARAIAGKVLEQLRRTMSINTVAPLIVCEEADVLFPAVNDNDFIPSSTLHAVDLTIKEQKLNVELAYIVQDPNRLHPAIFGNRHSFIYGQLPDKNDNTTRSRQLVWDIDRNYREFILETTGVPGYQPFVPFDSSTIY